MKKILRAILIVCSLLLQTILLANTIIIKGTVTDNNQKPVANKVVRIYTDSNGQVCLISRAKVTNPNGFYIDTLSCNGDFRTIKVDVEDCTGKHIINLVSLTTSSNIVESNFIICNTTPGTAPSCRTFFSYLTNAAGIAPNIVTPIKFSSAESWVPAGDSIISRTWYFGDSSSPVTGNQVDITHSYVKAGTYQVYLLTKTAKGCEGKYTLTVTITNPTAACQLQVSLTSEKINARSIRFNSSQSKASTGDSIISRIWKFSDRSAIDGNEINPLKVFKDTGTYTACLTVKTKAGCIKETCLNVVIKDTVPVMPTPTNCKALFTHTIQGFTVTLNSAGAQASSGLLIDSIISRTWYFSDSSNINNPIDGNLITLTRTFSKPGTYPIYLAIKTKYGCISRYGASIVIAQPTTACQLQVKLTTEKLSPRKFKFSTAQSTTALGDTIIERRWKFGDGSVQEGTEMTFTKEFKDTGTYSVCVILRSKSGCAKDTCFRVQVKDSITTEPIPTSCKAQFTYTIQGNTVSLNSSSSAAGSSTDSIVKRTWYFTDSTANAPSSGNLVNLTHTFSKAGTYNVYLVINTKKGCESKFTATLVIANTPVRCEAQAVFNMENVNLKKISFTSSSSKAQAGDSIIQRNWSFGDSTILNGNEISPIKEYARIGFYKACLQIKTAKGCEATVCKEVAIRDTTTTPQSTIDYIKIMSINPNPVITRMMLTLWNRNNNVETEISIFDIYGNPKFTTKKMLAEGNNIIEIATDQLYHGPYFLKVSTKNGRDSKQFYKL